MNFASCQQEHQDTSYMALQNTWLHHVASGMSCSAVILMCITRRLSHCSGTGDDQDTCSKLLPSVQAAMDTNTLKLDSSALHLPDTR